MTTPQAYWLVFWGRFKCRVLGRHQDIVKTAHGYEITWCCRCYRHGLRRGA